MAGASDLNPSLTTPLAFWTALLADQKWDWAEAWLAMNPTAVSPDEVLAGVLKHSGGAPVADRLGLWALNHGADPTRRAMHNGVHGLPLQLALLTQRPAVAQRLLEDARATEWLQTPWVGGPPLAHGLMAQGRFATVEALMPRGLPMEPALDGSWPWEHAPWPLDVGTRAGQPLPSTVQVLRLNAMGVLPTTPEAWQAAATRMSKGVRREDQPRLQAWLRIVAEHSVVTTDQEKQAHYLSSLVAAWVRVPPPSKQVASMTLAKGLLLATQELPPEAWIQPVHLPHLAARAGTWTLAGAVAWVHAMMGSHHTPAARYNEDNVTGFAWWDKLALVSSSDPVWDAPIFSEKGGEVTLRGLRSLAKLESIAHPNQVMGQTRTPVWPHALTDADHAAALKTLRASVGHWGTKRRERMGDWVSSWLLPDATASTALTPAQQWATEKVPVFERLSALLVLQKSMENLAMHRILKALTELTPKERDTIKAAQWRTCAQFLKGDPTWLWESQPSQNPHGVAILTNPLLQERRLFNPTGPNADAIARGTLAQHFLRAPLVAPEAPFNQRLTLAVQTYWHVCDTIPTEFHSFPWTECLRKLQQPANPAAESTAPLADRINWWLGWHTHRHGKGSLQGNDWKTVWDLLRAQRQTNEPLSPVLATPLQSLFRLDPTTTTPVNDWVANWKKDVALGLGEPPWQWLPKVGIPVSDRWKEALLDAAQSTPEWPSLEAQMRQAAAQATAPDRHRSRPRLRS